MQTTSPRPLAPTPRRARGQPRPFAHEAQPRAPTPPWCVKWRRPHRGLQGVSVVPRRRRAPDRAPVTFRPPRYPALRLGLRRSEVVRPGTGLMARIETQRPVAEMVGKSMETGEWRMAGLRPTRRSVRRGRFGRSSRSGADSWREITHGPSHQMINAQRKGRPKPPHTIDHSARGRWPSQSGMPLWPLHGTFRFADHCRKRLGPTIRPDHPGAARADPLPDERRASRRHQAASHG